MSIVAPLAGAYTGTLNSLGAGALALNYTRSGINLNFTQKGEKLEETDIYAFSLVEVIGRGMQMTIDCICKVYSACTRDALFPWTTPGAGAFGRVYNAAGPIGQRASATPDVLIFTVVANTSAAGNPTSLTAPSVILSPDNNLALVFSSIIREVPLKWDVLLTDSAGTGSLFSVT